MLQLDPGGLISGHHQRLFFVAFAQQVGDHEGREEAKLHGVAELEQLQVHAEHPLEYSRQVAVKVVVLGEQNGI